MNRFCRGLCLVALVALIVLQPTLAVAQDFGGGSEEEVVAFIVIIVGVLLGLAVSLAIMIFIIMLITGALKAVPSEYHEIEPGQVWLLLIPCFSLYWNFVVFQKVPKSFQKYYAAQGRTDQGDCGEQLGLWYSICCLASMIPYIGCLFSLGQLVLLIMFVIKMVACKGEMHQGVMGNSYPNP